VKITSGGTTALSGVHHTPERSARNPGFHQTDTVDYALVLEGEVWAVLDDTETLLKAGPVIAERIKPTLPLLIGVGSEGRFVMLAVITNDFKKIIRSYRGLKLVRICGSGTVRVLVTVASALEISVGKRR